MTNTQKTMLRSLWATAILAGSLPAAAGVIAYDGVPTEGNGKYNAGSDLFNQNPTHVTIIGENGTWNSANGTSTSVLKVNAASLAYPAGIHLAALGGSIWLSHTDKGGTNARSLKRALSPALGGKSFYFSVLIAFDDLSAWTGDAYAVCGLTSTRTGTTSYPATDGILAGFQKNGTQVDAVVRVLETAHTLQANVSPGTHFVVVKFTFNPEGNDTVEAVLNPTSTEPEAWTVSATAEVLTSAQSLAWVNIGGNYGLNSKYVAFDEWRIGDSYADVAGSEEAPAQGLPVITNSIAVATGKTTALLTGHLITAAPPATVHACWDTADKGTSSTSAWARVELTGTYTFPLTLSYAMSGLLANNTYCCRFYATNDLGSTWSDVASFATAKPSLTLTDAYAYEGDAGTSPIRLAVALDAASAGNAVVNYATRDSSAVAGTDYVGASGTLVIPPGVVSTNLTFDIIGNQREEFPGKRFWVDISAPVGVTLGTTSAEAGILDDDMGRQLFHDDFDDGNDAGWTKYAGTWDVVNQSYRVKNSSTYGNAQAGDTTWSDYGLRAMVRITEGWQSARMRLRAPGADDPGGGYLFMFQRTDGNQMYSGSLMAGTNVLAKTPAQYVPNTRLGTTAIARPVAMRVRTLPEGTRIQCYVGFTPIYDVLDTANIHPQGRIGLGNGQWTDVYFDNVEVHAEPSPPVTIITVR